MDDCIISGPTAISIGDIDCDGIMDLAVIGKTSREIQVLLNSLNTLPIDNTKAKFFLFKNFLETPSAISIDNINGDGRMDIAVSNWDEKSVSVFMNLNNKATTTPEFSTRKDYSILSNGSDVELANVNNDGKIDLVTVNQTGKSITVLFNTATVTSVNDNNDDIIVKEFSLSQNYPNPFNPATVIEFSVPNNNVVTDLSVYDILGRKVATLINEVKSFGNYKIRFDASALSLGIYFYRLINGANIEIRKMILMK